MENIPKVWPAKENLSQAELARQVGISRQTINATETGKYDPSLELAFKLANRFNGTFEDIFTFHPESGSASGRD